MKTSHDDLLGRGGCDKQRFTNSSKASVVVGCKLVHHHELGVDDVAYLCPAVLYRVQHLPHQLPAAVITLTS